MEDAGEPVCAFVGDAAAGAPGEGLLLVFVLGICWGRGGFCYCYGWFGVLLFWFWRWLDRDRVVMVDKLTLTRFIKSCLTRLSFDKFLEKSSYRLSR